MRAIVGFLAAAALLAVLGMFTVNSHLEVPKFDDLVRAKVQSFGSPGLTSAMRLLTRLGSTVGLTAIGVVVIAMFLYMRRLQYIGLLLLGDGRSRSFAILVQNHLRTPASAGDVRLCDRRHAQLSKRTLDRCDLFFRIAGISDHIEP